MWLVSRESSSQVRRACQKCRCYARVDWADRGRVAEDEFGNGHFQSKQIEEKFFHPNRSLNIMGQGEVLPSFNGIFGIFHLIAMGMAADTRPRPFYSRVPILIH